MKIFLERKTCNESFLVQEVLLSAVHGEQMLMIKIIKIAIFII